MTTVSGSTMPKHRTSALARLPNELLGEVARLLTTPELRLLGRENHKFKVFADDYLALFRYTSALFRLPKEILIKIADYVSNTADRSRFARTSQKFYPLFMELLVRHDIANNDSRCLVQVS